MTGYADPSGETRANQELSLRRADAVAGALQASKRPAARIRIAAGGASTGATVREARRVEITFGG